MPRRNVTSTPLDPRERYALYRLCDCPTCEGSGKDPSDWEGREERVRDTDTISRTIRVGRCPDCRGEGRIRQEVASCESPEAVGVALVRLGREREWEGCAFGLLDRMAKTDPELEEDERIPWLILPWMPSARNVRDAARTLARSKKTSR